MSHYEKGIRECGLDLWCAWQIITMFSWRLPAGPLGRPQRPHLRVDEIPSPETAKDNYHGSVLPTLNKKLISNSLNILFDKLNACRTRGLVSEISAFLMLAVYKMFRLLYNAGPKTPPACSA